MKNTNKTTLLSISLLIVLALIVYKLIILPITSSNSAQKVKTPTFIIESLINKDIKLISRPEKFPAERIYEKIDGRNVIFLTYGIKFLEFASLEFKKKLYDIYLYAMNTPLSALGAYLRETPQNSIRLNFTKYADLSANVARFCKKNLYITVIAMEKSLDNKNLIELSKILSSHITTQKNNLIDVYSLFPPQNIINGSIIYNKNETFGLKSLNETFSADYSEDTTEYTIIYKQNPPMKILTQVAYEIKKLNGKIHTNQKKLLIFSLFDQLFYFRVLDSTFMGVVGEITTQQAKEKLNSYIKYLKDNGKLK